MLIDEKRLRGPNLPLHFPFDRLLLPIPVPGLNVTCNLQLAVRPLLDTNGLQLARACYPTPHGRFCLNFSIFTKNPLLFSCSYDILNVCHL